MDCPPADSIPSTSLISIQPSWSFSSSPCTRPPSSPKAPSSVTIPSSSLEMCVTIRVSGFSPLLSRTVNAGPKSLKMYPLGPLVSQARKAMGGDWVRQKLSHRSKSAWLPRVNTTAWCWLTNSSVSPPSAVRSCTMGFNSWSFGITTCALGLPTSSSVRKKLLPRSLRVVGVSSQIVTPPGPASTKFLAVSMPTPFIPMMRTRRRTSLDMASSP
mmetsp:Transcript_25362/g.33103  ORF Transcript_25362/g.33103 Transcript_25362/m.33103 type:complete len:214 (-) Transcript_25362:66-707(-)